MGFYLGKELIFAGRVRAGFTPVTRRQVYDKIRHHETPKCPFANLPMNTAGRWGQGITAEVMKDCVWLTPQAVAQIDFLKWTDASILRHTTFVRLRDDKDPRKVFWES